MWFLVISLAKYTDAPLPPASMNTQTEGPKELASFSTGVENPSAHIELGSKTHIHREHEDRSSASSSAIAQKEQLTASSGPTPDEMLARLAAILNQALAVQRALKWEDAKPPLKSLDERINLIGVDVYHIDTDLSILTRSFSTRRIVHVHSAGTNAPFKLGEQGGLENYGKFNYICMDPAYSPYAPQLPGAPGLLFTTGLQPEDSAQNVMVGTGGGNWAYRGKYTLTRTPNLTVAEWNKLTWRVKQQLVSGVLFCEGSRDVLARVVLRRELEREPKTEEVRKRAEEIKEDTFRTRNQGGVQEIDTDYEQGKEVIYVWAMKCVGYDEAFQRSLLPT